MKDLATLIIAFAREAATSPVVAWRVLILLLIGGHVAWACNWLPGISGFALAGELDERLAAVQAAADTKIAQLDTRLSAIETKQDIALRIALAEEICRLHSLRQDASGALWQQLNTTFEQRQGDYQGVSGGDRYDVTQCSMPR